MKRINILFLAGIVLCLCSGFVFQNPAGSIANKKAHKFYDKRNYKSAFINYQKASKIGIPESQYYLSRMYLKGVGTKRNRSKAIMWLRKSADNGFAPAQVAMGIRHRYGYGVKYDLNQAYKFFSKAAKAGNPDGQYFLAFLLATGNGTPKNDKKALRWFRRAKSNGFPVHSTQLTLAGIKSMNKKSWVIRHQSRGNKLVRQIQSVLIKLGYKPGPVDGLLGKKTKNSIKLFQEKNKLVVDGKPSEWLLIKLKKVYDPIRNKNH
jgi:tetratricopeptide (TPR) repeat protein